MRPIPAKGATVTASFLRNHFISASHLTDGKDDKLVGHQRMRFPRQENSLKIQAKASFLLDIVELKEDIASVNVSQIHVEVELQSNAKYHTEGSTVGYRRLIRQPVEAQRFA